MNKQVFLSCTDCGGFKEFAAFADFTMRSGVRINVRSCERCKRKEYFTQDGTRLNKTQRRKARKYVLTPKELIAPINKVQRQKALTSPNKITPPKGLEGFLSQTSNLGSSEKGLQFEQFCQQLLKDMGYEVRHVGQSGDRGVDLRATRQQPIGKQTLVVQCKHQQSVSSDVVIQLYGMATAENANSAVVITTGAFTMDAKKFAQEHSNIEIIDGDNLTDLTNRYLKHD